MPPTASHPPKSRRNRRGAKSWRLGERSLCLERLENRSLLTGSSDLVFGTAFRLGASGEDLGRAIASDSAGNVYVVGAIEGTVDFDPGPAAANKSGNVFAAKYSSAGTLLWAKTLSGFTDAQGGDVAVDSAGNVYVTSGYQGTVDFDPGPGTASLSSPGHRSPFVLKLNSSGEFVWVRQFSGNKDADTTGIAVDAAGNIYAAGTFGDSGGGTIDLDPGAGVSSNTSAGGRDVFVVSLNSAGGFRWGKTAGGPEDDKGFDVGTDPAGEVYVAGEFLATADFDSGPSALPLTSAGNQDAFVWKLSTDGSPLWARQLGGPSTETAQSLAVDAAGSVYTTGYFFGDGDYDPGAGEFNLINDNSSGANSDVFVSKLTSDGNFAWAKRLGGPSDDQGTGLAVDAVGNLFVLGMFQGTVTLGGGTFMFTSTGLNDIFVARLSGGSGDVAWAGRLGGDGEDEANGIAMDNTGNVYGVGAFQSTADFDPGPGTANLSSAGQSDLFVSQLTYDASIPRVTINQAAGQDDPTESAPLNFTVVFSEPVTGFETGDVTLGGTAPGTLMGTVTQTDVDGAIYNVAVSGMSGNGTVVASLAAGVAANADGNGNAPSTSTDNRVQFGNNIPTLGPGTYFDSDGDTYIVKLKGPGTCLLALDDPDGDGRGPIDSILLEGTTTASTLSIVVKKAKTGDGRVSIGAITSIAGTTGDGSLKSISATKSDLTSAAAALNLSGAVGSLTFGAISGGGDIEIGGTAASSTKIKVARELHGGELHSGSTIASLSAGTIELNTLIAPAIGTISSTAGPLVTGLDVTDSIKTISVKKGGAGGDWTAGSFGSISIKGGGFEGQIISTATAESLGKKAAISRFSTTGDFTGMLEALGIVSTVSVGGSLNASLAADAIKTISVKKGSAGGDWTAGSFGSISIKGGGFEGQIISTATAESLGKKAAISRFSTTGDFTGMLEALGIVSSVSVGGSLFNSTVVGASLGSFKVGGNVNDSFVFAGANLGADHQLAGLGADADSFGPGSIKSFSVGGAVQDTTVGAGLDPNGMIFRNGNDMINGGAASRVSAFKIGGAAGAENYFRAGTWPKTVKVGGASVSPQTDARFLDLQNYSFTGTTDEDGIVTLHLPLGDETFEILDQQSGFGIPGLLVGVSTGTGTQGLGVLETLDPAGQYAPMLVMLRGTAVSGTAQASRLASAESSGVHQLFEPSDSDAIGLLDSILLDSLYAPPPSLADQALEATVGMLESAVDLYADLGALALLDQGTLQALIVTTDGPSATQQVVEDSNVSHVIMAGLGTPASDSQTLPVLAAPVMHAGRDEVLSLIAGGAQIERQFGGVITAQIGDSLFILGVDPPLPLSSTAEIAAVPESGAPEPMPRGDMEVISRERLGDGQRADLDASGQATLPVPPGAYTLVYNVEGRLPVHENVNVGAGFQQWQSPAPTPSVVKSLRVIATPEPTGLLDPGTEIEFKLEARDANGELIDPNSLSPDLDLRIFGPLGRNVADLERLGADTWKLTVGPDQGAVRVEAVFEQAKSKPKLVSGLGEAASLPVIVIKDASLVEGKSSKKNMVFDIRLSHPSTQTVTVDYNSAYLGSATPGSDYIDVSRQLTFKPGSVVPTQPLTVSIVGDLVREPDETFAVGLSNPTNARLALKNSAVGTIINDDLPTISINDVSQLEGDSGDTEFVFTVTLSAVSNKDVTVDYNTANGTAKVGSDYLLVSNFLLTIPAGELSGTVSVFVVPDTTGEADETFFVKLSNPVNATIQDGSGTGKIINDDPAPGVVIVEVIGGGFVTDSQHQIDTRIGDNVAHYVPDSFPTLTAFTPAGNPNFGAFWSDGTFGANVFLINSQFAGGLKLTVFTGLPLLADASAVPVPTVVQAELSEFAAAGLLGQAVTAWTAAGLNEAQAAWLQGVQIQVTDLPGQVLGLTAGNLILLDRNAAGYGWFVDSTPDSNEEFMATSATTFRALEGGPVNGRIDLLTVLEHELGHALGLGDLSSHEHVDELMAATLAPGVRRVAWAEAVDALFAE